MIERLTLAVVTAVPDWHPERAATPFPVHAWVVRHPDGPLLVDTGIGFGNPFIDELYEQRVTHLADALGSIGLAPSDITAVILSHLHFDHCGQHHRARRSGVRAGGRIRSGEDTGVHRAGMGDDP